MWAPDGKHVLFSSLAPEPAIWWQRADGGGEPVKLSQGVDVARPSSMSPDGRFLACGRGSIGQTQIWILPIDAADPDHPKAGTPEAFLRTPTDASEPAFSPDGHWLAYTSSESGTIEVYVRPFRGRGWEMARVLGRRQVPQMVAGRPAVVL